MGRRRRVLSSEPRAPRRGECYLCIETVQQLPHLIRKLTPRHLSLRKAPGCRTGNAGSLASLFSQANSYADLRGETHCKCLESGLHLPWDPVAFRTTPVNAESVTINKERAFVCSFLVFFKCFLIPNCVILLLQVLQVLWLPPPSPSCFLSGQAVIFSHLFTRPLQM